MPTPFRVTLEPGTSNPATSGKADDEMSPGTAMSLPVSSG